MFFYENNKQLYRCLKIPYSSLIKYEKAQGNIILFPAFTSTTEDEKIAKNFLSNLSNNLLFSVTFIITYICKNNWTPNAIIIQNESLYKNEKEIVIQPFSCFYVKNVKIDTNNNTADIYLESIDKDIKQIISH